MTDHVIIKVRSMPGRQGRAVLTLTTNDEGVRISFGERDVWVEVSDEGNLVAHLHNDQEAGTVSATIARDKITVEGDYEEI